MEQSRQADARRRRRLRLGLAGGAIVVAAAVTGIALGLSGGGTGGGSPASASPVSVSPVSGSSGPAGSAADYRPLSTLGPLVAGPAPGAPGPENVPVPRVPALAGPSAATAGQVIDQISCQTSEQTLFHIHTHLTIFVNGQQRQVPAAIGIPGATAQQSGTGPFIASGTCFYWLHTHAADGIIHIESPDQRTYTLGNFFDEWGQPLGPDRAGPATGKVTVLVNGRVFTGNPRAVPLGSRENLQLDVGSPLVAPQTINWASTGL